MQCFIFPKFWVALNDTSWLLTTGSPSSTGIRHVFYLDEDRIHGDARSKGRLPWGVNLQPEDGSKGF